MSVSHSGIVKILLINEIVEVAEDYLEEDDLSIQDEFQSIFSKPPSELACTLEDLIPGIDDEVYNSLGNYVDLSEVILGLKKLSNEDVANYLMDRPTKFPMKYARREHVAVNDGDLSDSARLLLDKLIISLKKH